METLSYINGIIREIEVGETYYFGQIWDGDGEGEELLESGAVSPNNESVVGFIIVEQNENILDTIIKVIDIY